LERAILNTRAGIEAALAPNILRVGMETILVPRRFDATGFFQLAFGLPRSHAIVVELLLARDFDLHPIGQPLATETADTMQPPAVS